MNLPDYLKRHADKTKLHEDNVKCLLFNELLKAGYDVIAEVTVNHSRYDLMIYNGFTPVVGIEVKNTSRSKPNTRTRQLRKYQGNGIPIIYCLGFEWIEQTIEDVEYVTKVRK